jgi:6-phosphogluconolactonase (cycloisomerase 2 family)
MQGYAWPTRVAASVGLGAALLLTSGCGFSSGRNNASPASQTYAYVGVGDGGTVDQFQVAIDGTLTPLSPPTVASTAGNGPGWTVADPSGRYLFASGYVYPPLISQFVIGAGGAVTPNSTATLSGGDGSYPFIFTPNGQFAIIPSGQSGTVSTYSLSSSGTLTLIDTVASCETQVSSGGVPTSAATDPSGQFVYVGCLDNAISEYSISASGALTPLAPNSSVPSADLPINLATSPKGFLYVVNKGAGTVTAFWIDESTGALANAGSFPTGTGALSQPEWITFDPTGAYAYVTNLTDDSVTQFTVNATTGALAMNGPDVPTGQWPIQVIVDPSGKFAYVANSSDGTVSQFTITSTGALAPNGTLSLGVTYGPVSIALAQP